MNSLVELTLGFKSSNSVIEESPIQAKNLKNYNSKQVNRLSDGHLAKEHPSQANISDRSSAQMMMLLGNTAEQIKNEPFKCGCLPSEGDHGQMEGLWRCGVRQTCPEPHALPFHRHELEPLFCTL